MKKKIGSNIYEERTPNALVFYSYNTPVACFMDGNAYRTEIKWSVTTSKHINKWLGTNSAEVRPQSFFDNLVGRVI